LTFIDRPDFPQVMLAVLTATPTPRTITTTMRLTKIAVTRLRERLTGASVVHPQGGDCHVEAEAEYMVDWVICGDADTLCDEGERGNPGESFD
jgi:hypothetical protein